MKKRQLSLLTEEPQRQLRPAPQITAPVVWVRELAVLRHLAIDESSVVRRIRLRPGMNILWAKTSQTAAAAELFSTEISGHAAGKTTFCRLLRHVLGEDHFGEKALVAAIRGQFPSGAVAAEVFIQGKLWTVCRPFRIGAHSFAVQGVALDQLFVTEVSRERFDVFREAVDHVALRASGEMVRGFPSMSMEEDPIRWNHVLPWLTRDQECRFSHLLAWRDTTSNSGAPGLDSDERQHLIRSLLGLIDADESQEVARNQRLVRKLKAARERAPLLAHQAASDRRRLESALGSDLPDFGDSLFAAAAANKLNHRDEQLQSERRRALSDNALKDEDEQLTRANEEKGRLTSEIEWLEKACSTEEDVLQAMQAPISAEERQAWSQSLPPSRDFCQVPMTEARRRGCSLAREADPPIDLEDRRAARKSEVERQQSLITQRRNQINQKRAVLKEHELNIGLLQASVTRRRTQVNDVLWRVGQEVAEIAQQRTLAGNAEKTWKESQELLEEVSRLEDEIRLSQERQATVRSFQRTRLNRFSILFEYTVRALLGKDVSAAVEFSGRSIALKVDWHGDRTSAAIDTIKILAFDLAALAASMEGLGWFPRFLIHDGPREADMAPEIYRKIFLYMRKLEECFQDGLPTFQYIVTTTEPPPVELQQQPWLLEPILDASRPETRLLGVDL